MQRRIAQKQHRKGGGAIMEELPFGITPQMYKKAMKYTWVLFVLAGLMLIGVYFRFSPYMWRFVSYMSDGKYGGSNEIVLDKPLYDFLLLSQQWPGSVCRRTVKGACAEGGKRVEGVGFTVPSHFLPEGLWPELLDGTHPSNCVTGTPQKLNLYDLTAILPDMHRYWPSYSKGTDKALWQAEWDKFGVCASNRLEIKDYFNTTIALRKSQDLESILAQSQITPSEEKYVNVGDIERAVKSSAGVTPIVRCQSDGEGGYQLDSIWMCVDPMNMEFSECPAEWKRPHATCGDGEVRFRTLPVNVPLA